MLDRDGKPMLKVVVFTCCWKVTRGIEALGHCSAYHFPDGDVFFCHGYSVAKNRRICAFRERIEWTEGRLASTGITLTNAANCVTQVSAFFLTNNELLFFYHLYLFVIYCIVLLYKIDDSVLPSVISFLSLFQSQDT